LSNWNADALIAWTSIVGRVNARVGRIGSSGVRSSRRLIVHWRRIVVDWRWWRWIVVDWSSWLRIVDRSWIIVDWWRRRRIVIIGKNRLCTSVVSNDSLVLKAVVVSVMMNVLRRCSGKTKWRYAAKSTNGSDSTNSAKWRCTVPISGQKSRRSSISAFDVSFMLDSMTNRNCSDWRTGWNDSDWLDIGNGIWIDSKTSVTTTESVTFAVQF